MNVISSEWGNIFSSTPFLSLGEAVRLVDPLRLLLRAGQNRSAGTRLGCWCAPTGEAGNLSALSVWFFWPPSAAQDGTWQNSNRSKQQLSVPLTSNQDLYAL